MEKASVKDNKKTKKVLKKLHTKIDTLELIKGKQQREINKLAKFGKNSNKAIRKEYED